MRMRKGFTLIELLIVLAIIAALMAVVTPIALNAVRKAKVTNITENLRNIKSAVEAYAYTEQVNNPNDIAVATLTSHGYLANLDTDKFDVAASDESNSILVFAYYKGTDIPVDDLATVLPGATSAAKAGFSGKGPNDDYPGLLFEVEKWY